MMRYDPFDWYWIVAGDEDRAWSSAARAYVEDWDGERAFPVASEAQLTERLMPYGIAGPVVIPRQVKAEAHRRIIAAYPDWRQANMNARSVELALILAQGGTWTEGEAAEDAALQAARDWIGAVRLASDAIEALTPIPADDADDSRWP